jgi:hypothetical protein
VIITNLQTTLPFSLNYIYDLGRNYVFLLFKTKCTLFLLFDRDIRYQLHKQTNPDRVKKELKGSALKNKIKDWFVRIQDNMSAWTDMSTGGRMFQ